MWIPGGEEYDLGIGQTADSISRAVDFVLSTSNYPDSTE
jgi:hypothetical protein